MNASLSGSASATVAATTPAAPVPGAQRILTLDIVRGFALLGIFIMNMPGFSTSFFSGADGSRLWPDPLNHGAELLRDMLFSGKFNSMFSLLFGIGFTIQYGRMRAADPARATTLYLRRLAALLGFALLHLCLFWGGDVLHIYALLGVGVLLLQRASDRVIWGLIAATLVYPLLSGSLRLLVMTPEVVSGLVAQWHGWEASNNLAFGHGSFADAAREHVRDLGREYGSRFALWGMFGFYVQMTTTMLLGVLIGRHRCVQRLPELMPQLRRLQGWALGIGVGCALLFGILGEYTRGPTPSLLKIVVSLSYVLCRLGLMFFYVLSIARLVQQPAWQRRFAPMAAAGRMPLTNYLMQTLIGTTIFYGWGFGLGFDHPGKHGPAFELLLAPVIFFAVQVPLSIWWLRHFEQGPLETLWRWLTYGRRRVALRVAEAR